MTDDPLRSFVGTHLFGIPMAQHYADLLTWERVLNGNPQLEGIVELGTWEGAFSLFLAAQAGARGMWFRTFDVASPPRDIPGFVQLDIFARAEYIRALLRESGPVALFCDGGNKPREMREFTPVLEKGSVVLVHDWGTEVLPEDVPDWLTDTGHDGTPTRVFTV